MQDKNDSVRKSAKLPNSGSAFTLVRQSKASLDLISKQTEAQEWIQSVLNFRFNDSVDFPSNLEDGIVLCRLALAIKPGSIKKVNPAKARFKMMENLNFFIMFCKDYGVPPPSVFHPLDLVERQNMGLVVLCIHALADLSAKRGFTPVMEKLFPDDFSTTANTKKNMRTSDNDLLRKSQPRPVIKQPSETDLKKEGKVKKKTGFVGFIDEPVFEVPKREEEEKQKEIPKPDKIEPENTTVEKHEQKVEEQPKEEPKVEEHHEKKVEEEPHEKRVVLTEAQEIATIDEPVFDIPKREDEEEKREPEEETRQEETGTPEEEKLKREEKIRKKEEKRKTTEAEAASRGITLLELEEEKKKKKEEKKKKKKEVKKRTKKGR